jgi:hypothetical protein
MFGIPARYLLKHPLVAVGQLAHPVQVWTYLQDTYFAEREWRRPQCNYEPDNRWERRLHESLGHPWPCQLTSDFEKLWPKIITELQEKGIRAGPESFKWWNDGDAGFVRAIWCLIGHLKPKKVVETGVAHGVTSRVILEALERNGDGFLWSIDLPPLEREWRSQVGAAVGGRFADRWSYIEGSSRRHLPKLLSRLGAIDLFIHDSLHSERNVRFEMDRAWAAMGPDGVIVVDDVDANWGFRSFTQTFSSHQSFICEAEPLHPDLRRFNHKGLFGIILKQPTAQG